MHVHFSRQPASGSPTATWSRPASAAGGHVWSSGGCSGTPRAHRVYG